MGRPFGSTKTLAVGHYLETHVERFSLRKTRNLPPLPPSLNGDPRAEKANAPYEDAGSGTNGPTRGPRHGAYRFRFRPVARTLRAFIEGSSTVLRSCAH